MKGKRFISVFLMIVLILSHAPQNVYAIEQYKEPLIFEDFEGDISGIRASSSNANVTIVDGSAVKGNKIASLEVTSSGSPSSDSRSLLISKNEVFDVSDYKYLTFWILDPGSNTCYVTLIDGNGRNYMLNCLV